MITEQIVDETVAVTWGGKNFLFPRGKDLGWYFKNKSYCFICVHQNRRKTRNKEHVLPQWLIKHCGLSSSPMHLPQNLTHAVSTYTVPICQNCNDVLGKELERPISAAFKAGYDGVKLMTQTPNSRLYAWMCFLYLKTHYKDMFIKRFHRNNGSHAVIGADIDWTKFSNAHAIVRSFVLGVDICNTAIGSVRVQRVSDSFRYSFMYRDQFGDPCNFIRVYDIAVICAFDDLGAANYYLDKYINPLGEALPLYQIASIYNEYILTNLRLYGKWDLAHDFFHNGSIKIVGRIDQPMGVRKLPATLRGHCLGEVIVPFLQQKGLSQPTIRALLGGVRAGSVTFLPEFALQTEEGGQFPVSWQRGQDLLPMERVAGADQND